MLYSCSGGAHRARGLLHQNTAIYASLISCSNLSLILLRNTVCVGHGRVAHTCAYFHFDERRRKDDTTPVRQCRGTGFAFPAVLVAAGTTDCTPLRERWGGGKRRNRKPRSVRENCDLRGLCSACFTGSGKRPYSVILSEAKNLSSI